MYAGVLGQGRGLFLTSKVRLHCDLIIAGLPFGQGCLFLTSKVRLHCDGEVGEHFSEFLDGLFLTSKVRLHCDDSPALTPDASHHFS